MCSVLEHTLVISIRVKHITFYPVSDTNFLINCSHQNHNLVAYVNIEFDIDVNLTPDWVAEPLSIGH